MVELLLLTLVITVVVLSIRRGKPVVLDNPLVIRRPGQYHITLAPQLNRVQHFIEKISEHFFRSALPQGDIASHFFEVRDANIRIPGMDFYLMAAAYRGGELYFQAINPLPLSRDADSRVRQIREFSEAALAYHPPDHSAASGEADKLRGAVELTAQQLKISVKVLYEAG